ncbi:MAG: DEAD/DEAH box helicase [Acidilobaceae archaeon]
MLESKLRFKIKGWINENEFRDLLEFSNYLGRTSEGALFEIDIEKMRKSGMTLRDVWAKLSSISKVDPEDLKEIERLYKEEFKVEVYLGSDGFLRIRSKVLLKPYLQKAGIDNVVWSPEEKVFKTLAHVYRDVVNKLSEQGFVIDDKLGLLEAKLPRKISFRGQLRDYQEEALKAWESNGYRGILALPTGSGKTLIAVAGTTRLSVNTLVVVYTRDHVRQWIETFRKFSDAGNLVGAYYSEEKRISPITVTTYKSALNNIKVFASKFALVVFDEAHHLPANTFKELALGLSAPFRLGLSATPEREDGRHVDIFPLVGGVVYHLTPTELAERGYLVPFVIKRIKVELSPLERARYESLRRKYVELARGRTFQELLEAAKRGEPTAIEALKVHSEMLDSIHNSESKLEKVVEIVKKELERGNKVIVFTQLKSQAEEIARRLNALLLHGGLEDEERARTLSLFKSMKSGVLVVTTVGDEGLDVPDVSVGVVVSGTGSRRQFIQRLGRLLRPSSSKKVAVLYEVIAKGTIEEAQAKKRRELV